jgi:hypothetical protein
VLLRTEFFNAYILCMRLRTIFSHSNHGRMVGINPADLEPQCTRLEFPQTGVPRIKTSTGQRDEQPTTANMVCFTALFSLASAIAGVVALPAADFTAPHNLAERSTPNETGVSGGYYYDFYSNSGGSVNFTYGAAGQYSVQWSDAGDFFGGKGWNPGSNR